MRQMEIKEIESPSKTAAQQTPVNPVVRPRLDLYVTGEDTSGKPDNVYRIEENDGTRTIVFNRPED